MSERLDVTQTAERIKTVDNVLIICHKNPDGDTIGSAGALCHAIKSMQKKCAIICADEISKRYDYMSLSLYDGSFEPQYKISVDVAGTQLFGEAIKDHVQRVNLCIDHHGSNPGYADEMLLDSEAAATAEIIYSVICELCVPMTQQILDCLYTGIVTDTGCFKFSNTTAKTHHVAQRLIELGANTKDINEAIFESKSKSRIEIERLALDSLEYFFDERCAMINLSLEQIEHSKIEPTDLEGITAIPRVIEGVDVGLTLRQQTNGSYKVSVRSKRGINASAICSRLGGGGHPQAAGCEVLGSLDSVKSAVLKEVERELFAQN